MDAAAGFATGAVADQFDGSCQVILAEVIEQDDVGAGLKHGWDLLKCIDFDFDREAFAGAAGEANHFGESVATGGSGHGEVVVLEHHPVEQADAVVVAATTCEGIFLQHAIAGQGLACIE